MHVCVCVCVCVCVRVCVCVCVCVRVRVWHPAIAGKVMNAGAFLSNCSTRVPLAAPGITRSPRKRICRGTLSQKTQN